MPQKNLQEMKENGVACNPRKPMKTEQKVAVIYYLSRNGHLEHPHFMVVPLSSSQGLYLKDVLNRLTFLRGQGITNIYTWSSKRSYKNGFVWHDLSEDDLIYPCQGHEYVLKGSLILESPSLSFRSLESFSSSSSSLFSRETNSPGEEFHVTSGAKSRKNQSCGSFEELREYQVYYKPKTGHESLAPQVSDASTQTEKKTSFTEIAVPSEVEGSLKDDRTAENPRDFGRSKASAIIMDLIKCGSKKV